jgi:hypothetical protein
MQRVVFSYPCMKFKVEKWASLLRFNSNYTRKKFFRQPVILDVNVNLNSGQKLFQHLFEKK